MALLSIPELTQNELARFWKYLRRDEPSGCLLWIGGHNTGYGNFYLRGKMIKAHRIAFVLGGGVLGDGMNVLHNCPGGDNPACCEYTHLWAGTQTENVADMTRKGRGIKSSKGLPYGASPRRNGPSRFRAQVTINYKQVYLGTFDTAEEASAVATQKRMEVLAEAEKFASAKSTHAESDADILRRLDPGSAECLHYR